MHPYLIAFYSFCALLIAIVTIIRTYKIVVYVKLICSSIVAPLNYITAPYHLLSSAYQYIACSV